MNKSLWNTVIIDGTVSGKILKEWIEHSYDEVVKKMPAKVKRELEALKK
jgi:predicted DNA-binding protein (MmcQ/YjbR family)